MVYEEEQKVEAHPVLWLSLFSYFRKTLESWGQYQFHL